MTFTLFIFSESANGRLVRSGQSSVNCRLKRVSQMIVLKSNVTVVVGLRRIVLHTNAWLALLR